MKKLFMNKMLQIVTDDISKDGKVIPKIKWLTFDLRQGV